MPGAEQAAAVMAIDSGEDQAPVLHSGVAGDAAGYIAAEDVVAVAQRDRAKDVGTSRFEERVTSVVAGDDAVGDVEPGRRGQVNTPTTSFVSLPGIVISNGAVADN